MVNNYLWGGLSDVGYQRDINEDYVHAIELDDTTLFVAIADGAGSKPSTLQPASIVTRDVADVIKRVFDRDKDFFLNNTKEVLVEAMHTANRVLGAFKMGNEELYSGFASSMTCCVLKKNGEIAFAHIGNTRMYLIRINEKDSGVSIRQLTVDHTKGKKLLDEGLITLEQYHTHPDRLSLTSGLGLVTDPPIQSFSASIHKKDFLLLTTDGIHYAIKPDPMAELVVLSETPDDASKSLVEAAKSQHYLDNMSAFVVWYRGENGPKLKTVEQKSALENLK